jgi:Mg-chelatase subunit ChlD
MTIGMWNPAAFAMASPWLAAAGVLLAGIPIVIHLLRRQRYQTRAWGAMRFVRQAARRRSRRTRLEALLLLAVRTMIILFVATALARPYIEVTGASRVEESAVQHVIIVDTSASMAYTSGGESRFEKAIDQAGRIVESARVGDAFNLLRIGGTEPLVIIRHPAYDAADVKREIARLQVSDERGRPLDALTAALELLSEDSGISEREVYLLTDLQASNWSLQSPAELQQVRETLSGISSRALISIIDIGESVAENAAVIDVQGTVRRRTARTSAVVTATFRNYGQTQRPGQRVELLVDGQIHETRLVDLPANGETVINWDVPVSLESDAVVEVRLAADELHSDDSRWLVLPPARDYRVLLVDGEESHASSLPEASGFLKLALNPRGPSATTSTAEARPMMLPSVISDGMLADVHLDEFDCVYLCNVALLTEREVGLLEQFVTQGGGLVIVLGDAVRTANYNELMCRDDRQLLPGRLLGATGDLDSTGGGFRFEVDDYSHPILTPFEGNETAGLLTTRIDRYVQTEESSDPATRVVLRYSSGDPAILERSCGDGRVLLVTTALDDHWGNWVLWPSFVPMMHELTRYAAAGDFGRRQRLVGEQIVRPIPAEMQDQARLILTSPDGASQVLRVRFEDAAAQIMSPPLKTPGPYDLQISGPTGANESYVVNIDPAESDLEKLDVKTLEGLVPPQSELRYLQRWQPRSSGDASDELARNNLSSWFLWAAFCLLLVEQLMAWRFLLGVTALCLIVVGALFGQLSGWNASTGVIAGTLLAGLVLWQVIQERGNRRGKRPVTTRSP